MTPNEIAAQLSGCLSQIEGLMGGPVEVADLAAWLQSWPSSSCGHGGAGGQMFTSSLVLVAVVQRDEGDLIALVWSAGRLLHRLPLTREVEYAIRVQRVPGRGQRWPEVPL